MIRPPVVLERAPWHPRQVGRKSPRHLESPLVVVPGIVYTFSWCHMYITGAISLRSSELPCWPWTDRLGVKSVPIRSPGRPWPRRSPALGWGQSGEPSRTRAWPCFPNVNPRISCTLPSHPFVALSQSWKNPVLLLETDRMVVARGCRVGVSGKMLVKGDRLPVLRWVSSEHLMYSGVL